MPPRVLAPLPFFITSPQLSQIDILLFVTAMGNNWLVTRQKKKKNRHWIRYVPNFRKLIKTERSEKSSPARNVVTFLGPEHRGAQRSAHLRVLGSIILPTNTEAEFNS